jgi:hypothetical protein
MGNPGAASHRTFSGTRKLGEKQLLEVNDVMAPVMPSQVVQTIEVNNGRAVGLCQWFDVVVEIIEFFKNDLFLKNHVISIRYLLYDSVVLGPTQSFN